jgi:hypothetical protein
MDVEVLSAVVEKVHFNGPRFAAAKHPSRLEETSSWIAPKQQARLYQLEDNFSRLKWQA